METAIWQEAGIHINLRLQRTQRETAINRTYVRPDIGMASGAEGSTSPISFFAARGAVVVVDAESIGGAEWTKNWILFQLANCVKAQPLN